MTWLYGKPMPGEWLVVDVIYRQRSVAVYRHDLGWCIRGRWLGHEAVECFQALPPVPEGNPACARNTGTPTNELPAASSARSSASARVAATRAR